ncbi:hypothetical protein L249_1443 [Ophiocordyceps polyrhachis-furcata BCC 54312]|uniref:Uncharacterized protein n=1 Tax=Ophiocordyceps polyrhachis-furcata BCC 54312 TaxID=1330021 RepID=A0A367L439_9HYPO|nr:hypothetical protein L249_1443 [Ophiocordyceps polyrhachis-furcata BCC 54312]
MQIDIVAFISGYYSARWVGVLFSNISPRVKMVGMQVGGSSMQAVTLNICIYVTPAVIGWSSAFPPYSKT